MDSFTIAQLTTNTRTRALAKEIATQQALVDALGLANTAGKSPEDVLAQRAEYEIALAELASKRQRLAELIRERDVFGVCL